MAGRTAVNGPAGSAAARHRAIVGWLDEAGRLDVVDLAGRLGVAAETVRRDLRTLETAGKLQRVHGGAVALDTQPLAALNLHPVPTPDALAAMDRHDLALANLAWEELPRRGTVLLGTGRLTWALAHAVVLSPPEDGALTVVTTSLDAAITLSRVAGLAVYNVGGTVSPATRAQEGDWALEELHRLHVDVAVVQPAGVCVATGLTQVTHAAAAVATAEVACADRVLALADPGTLGRSAFVHFAPLSAVAEVLVAGPPPPDAVEPLQAAGAAVRVVQAASVGDGGRAHSDHHGDGETGVGSWQPAGQATGSDRPQR